MPVMVSGDSDTSDRASDLDISDAGIADESIAATIITASDVTIPEQHPTLSLHPAIATLPFLFHSVL